jgi:hypothetical protein
MKYKKNSSFFSIITTDKVSEGKTRESGLDYLFKSGGDINFAIKSKNWPGEANVQISIFSFFKGNWDKNRFLDGHEVSYISSLFTSEKEHGNPYQLAQLEGISYTGTKVYGEGFIIDTEMKDRFIKEDEKNKSVIKPFVSGDDINSHHPKNWNRWTIDLNNYSLKEAREFNILFDHLYKTVYPERKKLTSDISAKNFWWKYQRPRNELYNKINDFENVLVMAQTAKHIIVKSLPNEYVYSVKCIVFARNDLILYANIQSSIHSLWAWKYGTTMGTSRIQYATTSCFNTFPISNNVETIHAEFFLNEIETVQDNLKCGLTEIFNAIHSPLTTKNPYLDSKVKTLRDKILELDKAMVISYGWTDLNLKHDFYEVDYLPENDRVRFTIHPKARKEVLKRLLLLNYERYEEEIKQGLHKKKDVEKFYAQKGQPVPAGVVFADGKSSAKKKTSGQSKKAAPKIYGQHNLFGEAAEPEPKIKVTKSEPVIDSSLRKIEWHHSLKSFKVIITNSSGHEFRYHVLPAAQRGKFTKNYKQISPNSPMALNIIGKQEGDRFEFGGVEYRIERIEM